MSERFLRFEMLAGKEKVSSLADKKVIVFGVGGVGGVGTGSLQAPKRATAPINILKSNFFIVV